MPGAVPVGPGPIIAGLGEVLWDVFPDGARFGGAPANFACSVAGLAADGTRSSMISAVGRDELGRRAIQTLADRGVDVTHVAQVEEETGQVIVSLDGAGHATYRFIENPAWDHLRWNDELASVATECAAVCFGTLAQRCPESRDLIRRFLRLTRLDCLRVFDVNLRLPYWDEEVIRETLPLSNVVKCNDAELPVLADLMGLKGPDAAVLQSLVERYGLKLAALTRGERGSLLTNQAGETSDLPGLPTKVVDTVGAGDAFTAAMVLGMLSDLPLVEINAWAGRVASFVCSQPGATPLLPPALRRPPEC